MSSKTTKSKPLPFRYAPEDLKPRDVAADEAFVENFVARNKKALNQDLKAARASIKAGRGKRYRSSEELTAEIMTKLRLSARKA